MLMAIDNYWVGIPLRPEIRKTVMKEVDRRVQAGEENWSIYDQLIHWIVLGADRERTHQNKPTFKRRQKTR